MKRRVKNAICELTGRELPKKKTTVVAGCRVARDYEVVAESLLIDMPKYFFEGYKENRHSAAKRLKSLLFMAAVIRCCREFYHVEPTAVIINLALYSQAHGAPLHESFTKKLLDYACFEPVRELDEPAAVYAVDKSYKKMHEILNEK